MAVGVSENLGTCGCDLGRGCPVGLLGLWPPGVQAGGAVPVVGFTSGLFFFWFERQDSPNLCLIKKWLVSGPVMSTE